MGCSQRAAVSLIFVLSCCSVAVAVERRQTPNFACDIGFAVDFNQNHSWSLGTFKSAPYALLFGGQWLSSADGSLVTSRVTQGNGSDVHGDYTWLALDWRMATAGANAQTLWTTSFQCYGKSAIVFSQRFPHGLNDIPGGPRDFQQPSSRFPSFAHSSLVDVPLITFANQNAARTLHAGLFPKGYTGGYGSGPIAFSSDADNLAHSRVFVLSAMNSFTAALHNIDDREQALSFGVGGLMARLPAGYTSKFVATACNSQLTWRSQRYSGAAARAFIEWGSFLLAEHGQERTGPDANKWISELGYSTTGVFHYNPCDCPGNQNGSYCASGNNPRMPHCHTYEDTLHQVHAYSQQAGIPYRWWLIDSWWHAFDNNTYFEDLPAQVHTLFPSGLRALYQSLGEPSFGAHWSSTFNSQSPYVSAYGHNWSESEDGRSVSPLSGAVWEHIFGVDGAWGLQTIKMDHNNEVYQGDPCCVQLNSSLESGKAAGAIQLAMLTDPLATQSFILSMADSAHRHGASIMPCMSNPNVLLFATMTPAITHARASPDSHPNSRNYIGFGGVSAWFWAVGIWPFKDVFYTNSTSKEGAANIPNSGYDKGRGEDQPWTHAVVAALSGGGVAPGDVVGGSDVDLILQTCRSDGVLLKPTSPAAYIDRTWQALFRLPDKGGAGVGVSGLGETSCADSVVSGLLYKICYVLPPTRATAIEPAHIGLGSLRAAQGDSYVVYTQRKYGGVMSGVERFGAGKLALKVEEHACNEAPDCLDSTQLFVAAPVLPNGWCVLGETTKIVSVSAQRIASISAGSDGAAVVVDLIGASGEHVEMGFMDAGGQVVVLRCAVGLSGRVRMRAGAASDANTCVPE